MSNLNNTNRLMQMDFSRYTLKKTNFTTELFIKLLQQMPSGTEIRAFAERTHLDCYSILFSHESFPEVPDTYIYPIIQAKITTTSIDLIWPEEYKKNHICQWEIYQGFSKAETVCKICGVKQ